MPAYYLEAFTVVLGIFLLMVEAFGPTHSKKGVGIAAALGLAALFVANFFTKDQAALPGDTSPLWNFYTQDSMARFFKGFALLTTLLVVIMSLDFRAVLARFTDNRDSEDGTGEYYALPVFACAGMMWMASARDLAGAFVALELVTITFYILVAFLRRNVGSLEAGVKYLILGALSTGFLVYGIAWIYGVTGTMNLDLLGARLTVLKETTPLLFGVALVLIALGFKIGAVPMHVWIPDVYQGAPTPTTAFLSVGSKAAGFVLLMRFLTPLLATDSPVRSHVLVMLSIMAAATLLFGNLAAIGQTNFKRLLAYSSIANAGFLLLALAAGKAHNEATLSSNETVSFYLATYLIMTLAAFFIFAQVRVQNDSEQIEALNGLGKRNPTLAFALTLIMASLAGVPLTAGFLGKWFAILLAVGSGLWWGVGFAVIGAAAGFYYYFRIISAIWWNAPADDAKPLVLPKASNLCVGILTIAIVVIGVWPKGLEMLLK